MWLVTKHQDGTDAAREPISANIVDPMVRWYVGEGSAADEQVGVALVQKAKMFERWLACACLGDTAKPPLLSPAYLSEAETFYLRRLTGQGRPEHHVDCPFHRDQTLVDRDGRPLDPKALAPPSGYFAALKPLGEHLAQQPVDDADDNRVRGASVPRLARLMWLLLDGAGTNVIDAPPARERPCMSYEFERVRAVANDLFVAPGKPLAPMLFTHARALHSNHIYARLRAAAAMWPAGYEPQAFLLTYAQSVGRREILLKDQDPIIVTTDIARPPVRQIAEGPFLVLVAIGEHARGLAPVRAYAQPILSGRHFLPLFADAERTLLAQLQRFQWDASGSRIAIRIKRPLFDIESDGGPVRPTFMLDISGAGHTDRRLHFVQLSGVSADEDRRLDGFAIERLSAIAPVTVVTGEALADDAYLAKLLMPLLFGRGGTT